MRQNIKNMLASYYREATVDLTATSSPYSIIARLRFTVAEHYNNSFVFEATSVPVDVTIFS